MNYLLMNDAILLLTHTHTKQYIYNLILYFNNQSLAMKYSFLVGIMMCSKCESKDSKR